MLVPFTPALLAAAETRRRRLHPRPTLAADHRRFVGPAGRRPGCRGGSPRTATRATEGRFPTFRMVCLFPRSVP